MKPNSITVAIPTYEVGTSLITTLNSLYEQNHFELVKEVLLLLDGKVNVPEAILAKIQNKKLIVVSDKNRLGQASRINYACEHANTDLLVLTNDDVKLDKDALLNIYTTFVTLSADLISTRALPDTNTSILDKALFAGQRVRERISETYKKGDNYMSCNGRLIGLSKNLYKQIKIPASLKNNDAYIYLFTKSNNFKHIYTKKSVVFYSLPKTLKEHINQSNRFQKSASENTPHFSKAISDFYTVPLKVKITATIKEFISNPVNFLTYIFIFLITRINKHFFRLQSVGFWETDISTKTYKSVNKICFWGSYDPKYSSNKIIRDGLTRAGVRVVEINIPTPITALNNGSHLNGFALINRLIKKINLIPYSLKNLSKIKSCDYIWVGYPGHFDLPLAWIVSKITGVPVIFYPVICLYITFTEDIKLISKTSVRAKILKAYEWVIYRLAKHLFADAPFQAKAMEKLYGIDSSQITSIPVGADDKIYTYSPLKPKNEIRATYYGLYSPLHGVEYIIEAANITKANKNITYHMVGKGQTYQEMKLLAEKYKLNNIYFYPESNEDNSKELLAQSDIFFGLLSNFNSNQRTIGNKAYQGLALGKVVVNANTAAARHELKNGENVYLVNQADAADLAKALTVLQKNNSLRISIAKNGHETYLKKYTPTAIAEIIINTLSQLK